MKNPCRKCAPKANSTLLFNFGKYVTRMYSCHLYAAHMYLYVTRMYSYVIRMSLACHPYVTLTYSYDIFMSLVCTSMSSLSHSYVLVCLPYVTRMWFYHEPLIKQAWCLIKKAWWSKIQLCVANFLSCSSGNYLVITKNTS